jgi:uncharacterized membrane protein YciS (DUF1049 family)
MTQDAWRRVAELKETLAENQFHMSTLEGEGAARGLPCTWRIAGFMSVNVRVLSSCYG